MDNSFLQDPMIHFKAVWSEEGSWVDSPCSTFLFSFLVFFFFRTWERESCKQLILYTRLQYNLLKQGDSLESLPPHHGCLAPISLLHHHLVFLL